MQDNKNPVYLSCIVKCAFCHRYFSRWETHYLCIYCLFPIQKNDSCQHGKQS